MLRSATPLLLGTLVLTSACANSFSGRSGAGVGVTEGFTREQDPPLRAIEHHAASERLGNIQQELKELKGDIGQLEGRVGSALGAVNWNLMRYPHCVDELFETAARLDLGRRKLASEQMELQRELERLRAEHEAGRGDLGEITRLANRVQYSRDQVTILNAELAHLFTRTMRRESPCGDPPGR